MGDLVRRLGKPRSWWLFMAVSLFGIVIGTGAIVLTMLGVPGVVGAATQVVLASGLLAVAFAILYFRGQLTGRYRDLQGRPWSELPW